MASNLSNVINYCRIVNGSKGFNDTKTQFTNEITQDYNSAREDTVYRFDVLINSIDAKDVYVNDSTIPIKGVVDISRKQTADTEMEEKLQVYPNLIKRGDIIKFKVNETDELRTYLIKSNIDKKHGYDEGIFEECNYILKWMIKGEYFETPAIVTNNTKYTLGVSSVSNSIIEGSGMFGIILSDNKMSSNIKIGQRFIVNGQAWEATQTDRTTTKGILSILLGESSINTNDDMENEIANAFEHSYTITLDSTSQSLFETGTYEITPIIKDKGIEVSNPNNITYTSSDETIATVNNGLVTALTVGNCIITCSIGGISTNLAIEVTAKTVTPVVSYGYNFSQSTNIKQYVTSILTCTETTDSVTTPLNISCSWDSVGQSLISSGKIVITTKSSSSIGIKNALITSSTVAHLTVTDIDTGTIILDNVAITFIKGI